MSVFAYKNGKAELIDTVKIDSKKESANGAAIRLSKDGNYLYVSLREENKVTMYEVNGEKLTFLQAVDCGGDSPRDLNIYGKYFIVCNEKSGNVAVFSVKDGLIDRRIGEISIKNALCCV